MIPQLRKTHIEEIKSNVCRITYTTVIRKYLQTRTAQKKSSLKKQKRSDDNQQSIYQGIVIC